MTSRLTFFIAWISIALVLNLCACGVTAAEEPAGGQGEQPDSTAVGRGGSEIQAPSVSAKETPLVTSDEEGPGASPEQAGGRKTAPIYKNRWVWAAAAGVLVAVLVAVAASGGDEERQPLPDFPDPPAR